MLPEWDGGTFFVADVAACHHPRGKLTVNFFDFVSSFCRRPANEICQGRGGGDATSRDLGWED